MRKALTAAAALCLGAAWPALAENPGAQMATGFTRGVVNVVTSPLEIPRYISIDSSQNPYLGPCTGFGKGVFSFPIRAIFGCFDIASLGSIPDEQLPYTAFGMEPYVWEDTWSAPEERSPRLHKENEDNLWIFW